MNISFILKAKIVVYVKDEFSYWSFWWPTRM